MQEHEPGDTSVLTTLFAHNTWANLKLLDFCERLSDQQLDASAIGGFGSIRDTLQHIVGAEVSYVERVNGKLPERPLSPGQFPGFEVLKVRCAGRATNCSSWRFPRGRTPASGSARRDCLLNTSSRA